MAKNKVKSRPTPKIGKPGTPQRTPRPLTLGEGLEVLATKYPPRHVGHPSRKPKVATVTELLPPQGGETVNWRKQDSIPLGQPTPGIWQEPNHRGVVVQRKKDNKRK